MAVQVIDQPVVTEVGDAVQLAVMGEGSCGQLSETNTNEGLRKGDRSRLKYFNH